MIQLLKPFVLSLAVASEVVAQTAGIPRPDTLGANFDHSSPGKGTPSDYDFLAGKWTLRYQQRDPATGAYLPVVTGHWTGEKVDENLIADYFRLINRAGASNTTATYRVFNPQRGHWEIQGVAVRRGVWQPGISWSDGRDRFVVQHNPETNTTLRIRYYAIEPNRFLWRADGSRDSGKTWLRDVILIEAARALDEKERIHSTIAGDTTGGGAHRITNVDRGERFR